MRPNAKVVGFVCLVTGLAVGALGGSLVAHRWGQGHREGGKPAEEAEPEISTFFKPASELLAEFARGADGLSFAGGAKQTAGQDWLFGRRRACWYFVLSCKLTLDPKVEQPRISPIRGLDEKLTALAREKGAVLQEAGHGHAARHLDGGSQRVGPLTGKHILILEAREGFRYQYSTGKAHGVVQAQMDYLGKQGKGDEEVAAYHYEARVEEWSHARGP